MKNKKKVLEVGLGKYKLKIADYEICSSVLSKARGLMFRINPKPLLFVWKKPLRTAIHSFFVFQKFVAVWYYRGKIVEIKLVKPWTFAVTPKVKFNKLLEIPIHSSEMRNI
jgi:uncharacterized membrane protein (UPF0127 family)